MQVMYLEEKYGGFTAPGGLAITSFWGDLEVDISGADHVGFLHQYRPMTRKRDGQQIAILAVLAYSSERQDLLDDHMESTEEEWAQSPYIVDVGVDVEVALDDGQPWCVPASHPEDATMFILVIHNEWIPGHDRPCTSVRLFRPEG